MSDWDNVNAFEKWKRLDCFDDPRWTLTSMIKNYPPPGWEELFNNHINQIEYTESLINKTEYYPYKKHVFAIYYMLRPENISSVIIGQDPYHDIGNHGECQAMGLSFSVKPGDTQPSSLKNIFKELRTNYPDIEVSMTNGCLTPWVDQGVFLLNTSLTVKPHEANSHSNNWLFLTKDTISFIDKINNIKPIVYFLWGKESQSLETSINKKNLILKSSHPSGFSAFRTDNPFIGNQHFIRANGLLYQQNMKIINWTI